jgi:hypothetical protein
MEHSLYWPNQRLGRTDRAILIGAMQEANAPKKSGCPGAVMLPDRKQAQVTSDATL